jgi:ribosome recycling factor
MANGEMTMDVQTVDGVFKDTESRMAKAIESTRTEFASIRTGRAAPSLLDRLHVDAYGTSVPLKQVASVSSPDGRSLQVSAFDKGVVGAIRKAIETSDLGLNPNVDGQTIRLSIPPLTEDRRKDLVKLVRKKGEDGKVAVRNIRHRATDEVKALQKAGSITEDDVKRAGDQIQKLTDRHIKQIDELVGYKEKEIMEV